jgi:mannose-1-phosphate guanylyltransferase
MVKQNNYCVIMAGGIGSRFWPMSRTSFPKQFHDILGTGNTLIQMTYKRFRRVCPAENILVVTNEKYRSLVLEQLPDLQSDQVLCEPYMRNTAPCIAYANFKIEPRNAQARIIVAPSDHLVTDETAFVETINIALAEASDADNLVTLGIKPHRPDTGYGYIQFEEKENAANPNIKQVKTFTEKPDIDLANKFLASGDFYWNSGIFIWSIESIQAAFAAHLSDVFNLFAEERAAFNTPNEAAAIESIYLACDNISIDYGVMEKAKNVSVVLSDFGWSDLGTWGSLYDHLPLDLHNNGVVGEKTMLYNCTNNVVYSSDDKLVVLDGMNGFILVDTKDALLVCKKNDEQKIKKFVHDIKMSKLDDFI